MFKKIIFILIAGLFLSISMQAQDTTKIAVPQRVKDKLVGLFPQAQSIPVTWAKEGENYKGTLLIMKKPAFAIFDSTGKVIRIERLCHISYLPKKIVDNLNKQYPGNEILEIYRLTDETGKNTYKTTFQFKQTAIFNTEGEIVK